jgi:hypothetical protein
MTSPDLKSPTAQTRRRRGRTLEQAVAFFAKQLLPKHGDIFSAQSRAGKKRVLAILSRYLPPYPARSGRKPVGYISQALAMYNAQKGDAAEGKRKGVDWQEIALTVLPDLQSYRTELRRRFEIAKLREAVHSRRRRERGKAGRAPRRRTRE